MFFFFKSHWNFYFYSHSLPLRIAITNNICSFFSFTFSENICAFRLSISHPLNRISRGDVHYLALVDLVCLPFSSDGKGLKENVPCNQRSIQVEGNGSKNGREVTFGYFVKNDS